MNFFGNKAQDVIPNAKILALETNVGTLEGNICANIADIDTADATDEASAVTLANVNKAKLNEILAGLQASNQMASA